MYNIGRLVHRTRKGAKSKRLAYHFTGHCTKDKCNMTTIAIPLSKNGKKHAGKYEAIISAEDAVLADFRWRVFICSNTQYAQGDNTVENKRTTVFLHREVMKRMLGYAIPDGYEVDHIDGNGLNNTRENLRLATVSQNRRNNKRHRDAKLKYKGIAKMRSGKYSARINVDNEPKYLGSFDTEEEAYIAYCEAVDKYHGEYGNKGK